MSIERRGSNLLHRAGTRSGGPTGRVRARRVLLPLAGALLLTAACSGVQPPTAEMSAAELAIREAEQAGSVALAPAEMKAAREEFARAESAMDERDHALARRMAEQAAIDAKLAGATARAARAERSLDEVRRSQRALENEATQ